jgi:hypothetical protein
MNEDERSTQNRVVEAYDRLEGNISAVARECKITRRTVRYHLEKMGLNKKPLAGGTMLGVEAAVMPLPAKGKVQRYICTSAQNNTHVHKAVWNNLVVLAKHFGAQLIVGTFSYNQNSFGKLATKRGKDKAKEKSLWYDPCLEPYFVDKRVWLANGLVWCGEMNILPTAVDPLSGLETYSGRKSAIFPHAKMAMRSIATMQGEGTKLNYTTGTVTMMNYIQKKEGLKAEHHHIYGAVLVEVDSAGHWWVRQLDADSSGRIQDLDVVVENGKVTTGNRVEAITWGDIHAACLDKSVSLLALSPTGMLNTLRPKVQFIHDIIEGVSVNHHAANNPHDKFRAFLRGFHNVETELKVTENVLWAYTQKWVKTVIVDSNHDNWLSRWLREHDYRRDPVNAMVFLEGQLATFKALRDSDPAFNITRWAMEYVKKHHWHGEVQFLKTDESYTICDRQIECGMHGHLGPNGARGTPANLNKVGRRANTGHTHSAEIRNGLYVAGTSTVLDMEYNKGPSSWTHSHIVTYPNGKRTIVTMYAGKWRA